MHSNAELVRKGYAAFNTGDLLTLTVRFPLPIRASGKQSLNCATWRRTLRNDALSTKWNCNGTLL